MEALYITIPLAAILALIFLGLFFWSVKTKQYDDTEYIAHKMILDDDDDYDKTIKKL
ncbi:MAG: cbb3-type cytochrome oxidase assembly protein CcoS [Leptospiraceae bacterium]|nr:cbb3-type cytochrome oxidase assembly protein CcoS [Leptospiraceae bacterium]MDW7976998.1 cbb3-type cytochrome oxidase assembly protein CcoS [Leptospiraceae bacterium]